MDQPTNPVLRAAQPTGSMPVSASGTLSEIERATLAGTIFKQLNPILQFLELATRKPTPTFSIEDALDMEARNRLQMRKEMEKRGAGAVIRTLPERPGAENSVIRTLPVKPSDRLYEML